MLAGLIPIAMTLASEFLPDLVGRLVGRDAEKVAERVVSVASSIAGINIASEAEGIEAIKKFRANPDLQIELQMQLSNERLESVRIHAHDRISARNMASRSSLHAWAVCAMSVLVVVGFGIMLWLILGNPIPLDNSEIIYILLGTLAAAFTQVCNFWLGSSRSSQDKTSQITELKR